MTIEGDLGALTRLQDEAIGVPKRRDELIASLRDKIRSGGSTGNRIKDFVILAHDIAFIDIERQTEHYQAIEDTLGVHDGEFVLVVDETGRSWTRGYLGTITDPYLDFGAPNSPSFQIVTPKHVQTGMLWTGNICPLHSQPAFTDSFSKLMQETMQKAKVHLTGSTPLERGLQLFSATLPIIYSRPLPSKMFIGDEAVVKSFTEFGLHNREDIARLETFSRMMQTIGRNIALPDEATATLVTEIRKRKEAALANLQALVRQEESVRREINALGTPIPNTDEDAFAEITELQRRGGLHKLRDQHTGIMFGIKSGLKDAFGLGLHREDWLIVEEPEPGRRVEVDVKQLIRGYCEKFEIPIPQD